MSSDALIAAGTNVLEVKGKAGADAALVLGEDQQRAITHQIGAVALRKQIAHIYERIKMA